MKIGIDISQTAYENTGVANYLENLVSKLLELDNNNQYVLFYSSLRRKRQFSNFVSFARESSQIKFKTFYFPPLILDLLWNKLHIAPIEWFIGKVDLFISSDWTEPPALKAKKATILYDLIIYKHPDETDQKIVSVQKRKLKWVKKESEIVFCISDSTKKDAEEILGINEAKLIVIYPGL